MAELFDNRDYVQKATPLYEDRGTLKLTMVPRSSLRVGDIFKKDGNFFKVSNEGDYLCSINPNSLLLEE